MNKPHARADARQRPQSKSSPLLQRIAVGEAETYLRGRDLPKLVGLWPRQLADESLQGTFLILGKLRRALRIERRRGSAGHWSYDLNRHLALLAAYKAELARVRAKLPKPGSAASAAPERTHRATAGARPFPRRTQDPA